MEPNEIIEVVRILLAVGIGLSSLMVIVIHRTDAQERVWREYFDEHPSLRQHFDVWQHDRARRSLAVGRRCPEHGIPLDASGQCAHCPRRPGA